MQGILSSPADVVSYGTNLGEYFRFMYGLANRFPGRDALMKKKVLIHLLEEKPSVR